MMEISSAILLVSTRTCLKGKSEDVMELNQSYEELHVQIF